MIRIKTTVSRNEARKIIEWALQFSRNSCSDFDPTPIQLNTAAEYCIQGKDAWEAAAAIQEGRRLR